MKVYIVCYKEYAHGPKVFPESKVFLVKEQADQYAKELTDNKTANYDNDPMTRWFTVEKEVEDVLPEPRR